MNFTRNKFLIAGAAIFTMFTASSNLGQGHPEYEQQPPIPEKIYLQKNRNSGEAKNLILRVKFYDDNSLPDEINLAQYGDDYILRDNGIAPDEVEGDFNYAMLLEEDLATFQSELQSLENKAFNDGGIVKFTGHDGEFISEADIVAFDWDAFNNFESVQIYQPILDVALCGEDLKKEKSLFITDLSVIEGPARTYQMEHTKVGDTSPTPAEGNPMGAWTFGTLIKNMANEPQTGVSAKEFLKQWIIKLYQGDQQPYTNNNGFYYKRIARDKSLVYLHLIQPWLAKVNPSITNLNPGNWETKWDDELEEEILKYAPFRLMAIVNRIDLKGNAVYNSTLQNAGETRFIYTLINPTNGEISVHNDISLAGNAPSQDALDWEGMNIIIEYGNPFDTECEAKLFAQQWYDLSSSSIPLGSAGYNDQLQQITDQVTAAGAGGTKANGSALNQIRTNEKLFEPVRFGLAINSDW